MTDDEIQMMIQVFQTACQRLDCPHSLAIAIYLGVGMAVVAYPGIAGDEQQPKRDLLVEAFGFHRCTEDGEPINPQTAN